jgi:hypothetical protein
MAFAEYGTPSVTLKSLIVLAFYMPFWSSRDDLVPNDAIQRLVAGSIGRFFSREPKRPICAD